MAKQPKNHGKQYTPEDIKTIKKMAPTRPVGIIAHELGRTEDAIYKKAAELKISFERPERSPYGKPPQK